MSREAQFKLDKQRLLLPEISGQVCRWHLQYIQRYMLPRRLLLSMG